MRRIAVAAVALLLASACAAAYPTDFRITPGFGDRSGESVRVTFVTSTADVQPKEFTSAFDYSAPFRYRWKTLSTHTGLFAAPAGSNSTIAIPGAPALNVSVPAPGEGVRGVMTADICFSSTLTDCEVGQHDEIFAHLPALLNAILGHPSTSFWTTIGDNFYDPDGTNARAFFARLTPEARQRLYLTVPGNYDFWASGKPDVLDVPLDQFGNAFMQYYGMDTLASVPNKSAPWNFSVDPDSISLRSPKAVVRDQGSHHHGGPVPNQRYLPVASNFETYTRVGNLGFIAFSGAHHHKDMEPFLRDACAWMNRTAGIDWIIVMGHWAKDDKGASNKTTTPAIWQDLVTTYGCDARRTKYFQGHTHCNMVWQNDTGFLIGAFGKTNHAIGCSQFGIPYIDSTGGRLKVTYYPISKQMVPQPGTSAEDAAAELRGANARYAALLECVSKGPLFACPDLEQEVWLDTGLDEVHAKDATRDVVSDAAGVKQHRHRRH